jgi:hypothetical protein
MNRKLTSVMVVVVAMVVYAQTATATTMSWDSTTDLGTADSIMATNTVGAWTLGEAAAGTGAGFTALPNYTTSYAQASGGSPAWYGSDPTGGAVPNYGLPMMNFSAGHLVVLPHYALEDGSTLTNGDLRWTAPQAGTYNVSARWTDLGNGATGGGPETIGVTVTLAKNGLSLFSDFVASEGGIPSVSVARQMTLAAGDTLDFVVNSRGSHWNDPTQLDATITTVPEPTTLALSLSGLLGLLAYAWRKR